MSTPRTLAPAWAAGMAVVPSPQPRSSTSRPGVTPMRRTRSSPLDAHGGGDAREVALLPQRLVGVGVVVVGRWWSCRVLRMSGRSCGRRGAPSSLDDATTPCQPACSRPAASGTRALQARCKRVCKTRRRDRHASTSACSAAWRSGAARRSVADRRAEAAPDPGDAGGGPRRRRVHRPAARRAVGRRPTRRSGRRAAEQHLPAAQAPRARCPHRRPAGRVRAGDRPVGGRRVEVRGEPRSLPVRPTDPAAVVESYQRALDCFTGTPYAEFADRDWARADVLRLEEMRTVAREELLSARLALGEDRTVVADLEALVSEHPLRERPWHELAVALHRSGRSADALRRIAAFRSILRDELGLDPPAAIRQLEARILESDPALLGSPRTARRPSLASACRPRSPRSSAAAPTSPASSATSRSIGSSRSSARAASGKTRLAMRVAADLWDDRRGEVYVVELAPVHDPLSTVAAVATAIDVQQRQYLSVEEIARRVPARPERAARPRQLRTPARRRRSTSPSACSLRAPTSRCWPPVGRCSACRASTSGGWSRSPWRRAPTPLDELANVPAVRMFVERAAASNPGFSLDPDNAAAVAEIVRRVDGLPLAIELAAARSSAISPAALAERLRERFELLDHAQAGRSERHQTLTELVAWSFNLLNGSEQILFARVSVFAGSFGLDAVETICADESLDASSAARVLAALVDKSMVQLTDADAGRYRVLEPLREFGRARAARLGTGCRRRAPLGLVPRPRRAVGPFAGRRRRGRRPRPGSTASSATSARRSRASPNAAPSSNAPGSS